MALVSLPRQLVVDASGNPRSGARAYFYQSGTTTPITVYTTAAYAVPLTQPVEATASGLFPAVYVNPATATTYKIVVKTSSDTEIYSEDNIPVSILSASEVGALSSDSPVLSSLNRTAAEVAVGVTPVDYAYDAEYIERHGASTSSTDNLVAVDRAIEVATNPSINVQRRFMRSMEGSFVISAPPTNPYGIDLAGAGAIMEQFSAYDGTYYRQVNSYANNLSGPHVIGKEYLYHIWNKLIAGGNNTLNTFVYGDSTVAGGNGESSTLLIQNLFPNMGYWHGLPLPIAVTNRAVGGTSMTDMSLGTDLSGGTADLFIIKYGINDGSKTYATRLATYVTALRSMLATIRAHANGTLEELSIVLVGPTSTYDAVNQRDTYWYEQLRGPLVQAARDYQCMYIDAYAMLQDARYSAGLDMDAPYSDDRTVHPLNERLLWLWPAVFRAIFGSEESRFLATNKFINISGNFAAGAPLPTVVPSSYGYGLSIYRAKSTDSWPIDGATVTFRSQDGIVLQMLFPFDSANRTQIGRRLGYISGDTWTVWDGIAQALTYENSWDTLASWDALKATLSGGVVTVEGTIASGTTTAGTTIATLPAGMRPTANAGPFVCATNAGTCKVQVTSGGAIQFNTTGDATFTALAFSFTAA